MRYRPANRTDLAGIARHEGARQLPCTLCFARRWQPCERDHDHLRRFAGAFNDQRISQQAMAVILMNSTGTLRFGHPGPALTVPEPAETLI